MKTLKALIAEPQRCSALAEEEARALGAEAIDQEHLLIGLLRMEGRPAQAALEGAGLTAERAREAARALFEEGLAALGISLDEVRRHAGGELPAAVQSPKQFPHARATNRVFDHALREARDRRDRHIGTEHLLLGLLADDRGNATRVFERVGVSRGEVRARLEDALSAA